MDFPKNMSQFRPISLCNVIYNLNVKCITNRMKGVLDEVVAYSERTFVLRRCIVYNTFLAFETIHSMKTILK